MIKKLVSASLMGIALAFNAADASSITSNFLKITSASLTPTSLKIPTGFFCGGSCGFTATQPFLLTIGIRSLADYPFKIDVIAAHANLMEDDVSFDNSVGSFIQTSNLPTDMVLNEVATLMFAMNVDPTSLNAQCALGCGSNYGYAAELGALEFYALARLDFRLTSIASGDQFYFSTPTIQVPGFVPEPHALSLALLGLFGAAAAMTRRTGHKAKSAMAVDSTLSSNNLAPR